MDAELMKLQKDGEWFVAQLAVGGTPCIPFSVHASDMERFRTEEDMLKFLVRQAGALIELYGDARRPRLDPALKEE